MFWHRVRSSNAALRPIWWTRVGATAVAARPTLSSGWPKTASSAAIAMSEHPCAVCERPVRRPDREVQMQFEHDGRVPGLDTFHVHLRCFAAWEFERRSAHG